MNNKIENKSDEVKKLGYERENWAFKAYFCDYQQNTYIEIVL